MSDSPRRVTGDPRVNRERLAQIQWGMQVEDAEGVQIGHVAYVRIGDPSADTRDRSVGFPGEGMAMALGARPEPHVATEMVSRLLQFGYIKVDDTRRFRPDHHFYAMASEIVSVDGKTVRLSKACDELIKSSN
jgi:hypothetical protein